MNTANTALDPCVSEFETSEQAAEHAAWIRAELERRQTDPCLPVPQDEVVRRMEANFALWEQRRKVA